MTNYDFRNFKFTGGSLYLDGKYWGECNGMVESVSPEEGPDVLTAFETTLLYRGNIIDIDAEVSDVG